MFKSLKGKMLFMMIGLILLCMVLFFFLVLNMVKTSVEKQMEQDGKTLINILNREFSQKDFADLKSISNSMLGIKKGSNENIVYISVTDNSGNIVVSDTEVSSLSDTNKPQVKPDTTTSASKTADKVTVEDKTKVMSLTTRTGEKVYNISTPIEYGDSNGNLNVGISLSNINNQLSNAIRYIVIIALLITGFSIILIFAFAKGFISKPLDKVISKLSSGVEKVAYASTHMSGTSRQLAEGSNDQAAASEQISATMENTLGMVKKNLEITQNCVELSQDAQNTAFKGKEKMHELNVSMEEIKSSSDNISEIIKVIDEIAFQTNILSINAALEAARVGKAGKGFAVVAETVRSLAKRSAQAAKESNEIVEKNIKLSDKGLGISLKVVKLLDEINQKAVEVNESVSEISKASGVQSEGIEQVTKAIEQVTQVTQNMAANSEESASESLELQNQVEELQKAIDSLTCFVDCSKNKTEKKLFSGKFGINLYNKIIRNFRKTSGM